LSNEIGSFEKNIVLDGFVEIDFGRDDG